jgi:hypothetical protein
VSSSRVDSAAVAASRLAGRGRVPYDAGMERTTTARKRRRRRPAKATAPAELVAAPEVAAPPFVAPEPEPVPELALVAPEPVFAARVPPPAPDRQRPTNRHAIFFDVENTSNPAHIERVVGRLAIDHVGRSTEFFAVGNWRVIGHETGRVLARFGAQLLHSAPSTGVRDWSDLRIAVSAGVWLAGAHPGDVLEIVSDDRAFDAVGDVAAALGITFHRITARTLSGVPSAEPSRPASGSDRGRRRGRRGHRGGRPAGLESEPRRLEPVRPAPRPVEESDEAQSAPHDELVTVVRELAERSPNGAVLIDNVARALKARGFSRPPGSPRLVTRLRRIRELSVSPTGMISLAHGGPTTHSAPPPPAPIPVEPMPPPEQPFEAEAEVVAAAPAPAARRRRRSRRGGRGRRRASPAAGA